MANVPLNTDGEEIGFALRNGPGRRAEEKAPTPPSKKSQCCDKCGSVLGARKIGQDGEQITCAECGWSLRPRAARASDKSSRRSIAMFCLVHGSENSCKEPFAQPPTLIADDSGLTGSSSRQSAIANTLPRSGKSRERSAKSGEPIGTGPSANPQSICGHPRHLRQKTWHPKAALKKSDQPSAVSCLALRPPPSALSQSRTRLGPDRSGHRKSHWPKVGTIQPIPVGYKGKVERGASWQARGASSWLG